jgi:four helix bundle protein
MFAKQRNAGVLRALYFVLCKIAINIKAEEWRGPISKTCVYTASQSKWRIACGKLHLVGRCLRGTPSASKTVRAADSIGANIAEGSGRGTHSGNQRFVRIARGSLNESQHWLRRAYLRKLLTREQVTNIKTVLDELAPSLNAYLRSITLRIKKK